LTYASGQAVASDEGLRSIMRLRLHFAYVASGSWLCENAPERGYGHAARSKRGLPTCRRA
jgi:hypothetical protein